MKQAETAKVMKAIDNRGEQPQALFVGGCVRDSILGLADEDTDVDIATSLTPDEVTARLLEAGIKVLPTGIDHGTVTAVCGGKSFEITTLRRDIETDGRHAVVGFTQDWAEDARRRDFTMNTLLADMRGRIFDPLGCGIGDLEAGKVAFVGNPDERIAEDYLRILRFFRFHAVRGKGEPDGAALEACRKAAPKIVTLSRERITKEFFQIVNAADPLPTLLRMEETGVLSTILPTTYPQEIFRRLCGLQERYRLVSIAARLLVLIDNNTGNLPAMEISLVLSNALKKEIILTNEAGAALGEGLISSDKELIYRYKRLVAAQAIILREAVGAGESDIGQRLETVRNWIPPALPVSGDDILEAGVPPGPAVGEALARIERWWINNDFSPDREECLREILR